MATKNPLDGLPVPYDALVELGMSHEQILEAAGKRPRTVAFQADQHPDAWFDVARAQRALRALGAFTHTKGRWAGVHLRLGQGLDPWQVVWILAPVFGWVYFDAELDRVVRVIRRVWVEIPRKNGKALDVATPILTDRGWTTMGEIQVGDRVHGHDGHLTDVVATSEVFLGHDCYEVELSDGRRIVADAGHLWTLRDRGLGRTVTVTTAQMVGRTAYGNRPGVNERRYSMPTHDALHRPPARLPLDPYLLGAWLGDGETAGARITSADPEVIDRFRDTYDVAKGAGLYSWGIRGGFRAALRATGVLGNKHVPTAYLTASRDQRFELLHGLMDSDGTVIRGAGVPRCEFTSTNHELATAVLFLARSLGWKTTIKQGIATLNGREIGPKWRVSWNAYRDESPFALDRHTARLAERPTRRPRSRTVQVVAVRPVPSVPTRCIEVAAADGLYLAGEGLVTTHNSTISSAISGVLLLADQEPGAEVYNAAGSKEQAARVFEDAKRMLSTSKAARSRVEPLKDVVRVPRTASILRVLSSVAETAHGLNVSGAVVDEVHTLRRKAGLVDALETGVGARDQPLLLYITTADEAEDGTPYDEKHTYTLNVASGIISDPSFYGVVWGAEEGDDPFAESTWAKASPGFPKSPNRRYMETEAKKARNSPRELAVFKQLALNLRTASTSRWLDIGKWDELTARPDRARLRGRRAWAGLDLSATSDFTAWAVWVESTRPGYQLELLIDYWVPEDRVEALQEQLQVPLQAWVDQGYVHATEGDVIDYAAVKAKAVGDARHYDLQRISYDRMFAGHIVQEIDQAARGVDLVPVGQGFVGIGPAAKEFERLINGGLVILPDDPVSRWMALWVETKTDETDNIRPVKPNRRSSMRRIDGIQAAVTGLDGWVRAGLNTKPERKVTVFGRR